MEHRASAWWAVVAPMIVPVLCLTVVIAGTAFDKTFLNTGGSAQRLSTVLSTAGYAGPNTIDELTICNPSASTETLYLGQSNVNAANGFPLEAGDCKTERRASEPVDATQRYLFTNNNSNVSVSVRSR